MTPIQSVPDLIESMKTHDALVSDISSAVRKFYAQHIPFRIYHGSTNSTRKSDFDRNAIVDTSPLNRVLSVDASRCTCLVEPNVRMDALVDATLPLGLIPPVVPEFPGITVGGAVAGTAGESSSFKHGVFDTAVVWCEIVLGNGEIVRASREQNEDLFEGVKGSLGTLGVATLFELSLKKTGGWVKLEYLTFEKPEEMVDETKSFAASPEKYDFLDSIVFRPDSGVLIAGSMISRDEATHPKSRTVRFSRPTDRWFYLHVQSVLKDLTAGGERQPRSRSDVVELRDYLFRYDRGAFWTGKYAFKVFKTPFNRVSRTVLDPLMRTEVMYKALHLSGMAQRIIVQDVAIPSKGIPDFMDWIDQKFGIYPLWICPISTETYALFQQGAVPPSPGDMMFNVGIWGLWSDPKPQEDDWFRRFVEDNRMIERKVMELGGCKCLYAHMYYTEEEFWSIYDKATYDKLRTKWHAEGLPDVYQKIKPKERPEPTQPVRGVLRLLMGRNHILSTSKAARTIPLSRETAGTGIKPTNDSSSDSSKA